MEKWLLVIFMMPILVWGMQRNPLAPLRTSLAVTSHNDSIKTTREERKRPINDKERKAIVRR